MGNVASSQGAQHWSDGCAGAGAPRGRAWRSCPLFYRDCPLSWGHQSILLLRSKCSQCRRGLPIQTYTDCFPVQNLCRRREMACDLYINLFAAAGHLGTSMHVSFACNIIVIHSYMSSYPTARTNAQFMDRQRYCIWLPMKICFVRESFYCSEKAIVF